MVCEWAGDRGGWNWEAKMSAEMVGVGWWMEEGGDARRVGGCAGVGLLVCSLL